MKAPVITVLLVLFLAGCRTGVVRFENYPSGASIDRSPTAATYIADGDILEIIPGNQNGVSLANVVVLVIEGDVYLDPINISSRGQGSIRVDLADAKIPRDWRHRIYWIMNEAAYPIFAKERTIYRKKIEHIEEKTPSQALDVTPQAVTKAADTPVAQAAVAPPH